VAWEYANAAARMAATGFDANDVYRLARQLDDSQMFILTNHSPITWKDIGNASVGQALHKIEIASIKATAGTINVGQPVVIVGWDTVNDLAKVELAQSTPTGTSMPCAGLCNAQITDAAQGTLLIVGSLSGVDTASMIAQQPLYLSATPGEFVGVAPAGPNIVQALGVVTHSHASEGKIGVNIQGFRAFRYTGTAEALGTAAPGYSNLASPADHVHAMPKLDDTGAPDDNTDNDVSTSVHGLVPKAPNDAAKFLRGDATWAKPGVDGAQIYHVGKHGNDGNDGKSPNTAKLTFAAAIAAALAQTPSSSNRFAVCCDDAGIYAESLTCEPYIDVVGLNAVLQGSVVLKDNVTFRIRRIEAAAGTNAFSKSAGSETSYVHCDQLVCAGSANGINNTGTDSVIIAEVGSLTVVDGTAVIDSSGGSGHTHIDAEDVYISGNGKGLVVSGEVYARITELEDIGAGTTVGIETSGSGKVRATVASLKCDTAYNVGVGSELRMVVVRMTGTETVNGDAHVTLAGASGVDLSDTDPVNVTKAAASEGTASEASRQDHKHDVTTAAAGAATPGDSAAEGSAASLARSDHKHSLPAFGASSGTFCEGDDSRLNASPIHGSEFQEESSDGESSTTAGSFEQKLRLTTPSLPAGTYRIGWHYEWNKSGLTDFVTQVQVNDTTTMMSGFEEAVDSGSDQWYPRGGYGYYTGSGLLTVDLDYHANSQNVAKIRRARLEIWRVS